MKDGDTRRWLIDAVATVACLAVLSAVFWRDSSGAFRVWIDSPTFNHCFLILPMSLFTMWSRRHGLAAVPHVPQLWAALLLLPLSFVWLVAYFAAILEAQQFVVITMLQVMLIAVLGWPAYRKLIAGFLFLYFLVPSGAELVPALQQFTAHFAVVGLRLIGIPVFSDGAVIEIPAGSFAVAEACAGLRFLVAAVAFGVFYATHVYSSVFRRLIFVALSVVVPIIANGLRVFGLIAAAQWLGDPTAALADHLIYGWGFFSLVLVVLVFAGRAFSDRDDDEPESAVSAAWPPIGGYAGKALFAGVLCVAVAAIFPVAAIFMASSGAAALPDAPPTVSQPWKKVGDDSGWTPIVEKPSRTFSDAFSNGRQTFFRFVALYRAGGPSNLIRSENRIADEHIWKYDASKAETLRVAGKPIPVIVTTIENGTQRLTVWSFYVVGGKIQTSVLAIKLRQLRDQLLDRQCPSAFVAVAADDLGRPTAANAMVARYLASIQSMPAYLCRKQAGGKS
jgi:exosortase A